MFLCLLSSRRRRSLEQLEEAPGEMALQAPFDLVGRPALTRPASRIGLGFGVVHEAGEDDRVEGPIELAIARPVEPVTGGLFR
jgi:hypothetical protein